MDLNPLSIGKRAVGKINGINERYSRPRIKMTPLVKFALLFLRLYLIFLVLLLVYKFVTMVWGGGAF